MDRREDSPVQAEPAEAEGQATLLVYPSAKVRAVVRACDPITKNAVLAARAHAFGMFPGGLRETRVAERPAVGAMRPRQFAGAAMRAAARDQWRSKPG